MRGSRAKKLRTEERPNPGRKHGGTMKEEAKTVDEQTRRKVMIRKLMPGYRPDQARSYTKNLMTSKHSPEWAKHKTLHGPKGGAK